LQKDRLSPRVFKRFGPELMMSLAKI